MDVFITQTAEENLSEFYAYLREYNEVYADEFHDRLVGFIIETLSAHPKIGHVYNAAQGLRRLIFKKRYNIYYQIKQDGIFVLFILDGKMLVNIALAESGADLD